VEPVLAAGGHESSRPIGVGVALGERLLPKVLEAFIQRRDALLGCPASQIVGQRKFIGEGGFLFFEQVTIKLYFNIKIYETVAFNK
jgi:hypothetical protein